MRADYLYDVPVYNAKCKQDENDGTERWENAEIPGTWNSKEQKQKTELNLGYMHQRNNI